MDQYRDRPQHDLDAMRDTQWELTAKGRQAVRSARVSGEVPAGAATYRCDFCAKDQPIGQAHFCQIPD